MIEEFEKQTELTKEELATALRVIKAFKECESEEEWFITMFMAWAMLEELEGQLERMTK